MAGQWNVLWLDRRRLLFFCGRWRGGAQDAVGLRYATRLSRRTRPTRHRSLASQSTTASRSNAIQRCSPARRAAAFQTVGACQIPTEVPRPRIPTETVGRSGPRSEPRATPPSCPCGPEIFGPLSRQIMFSFFRFAKGFVPPGHFEGPPPLPRVGFVFRRGP